MAQKETPFQFDAKLITWCNYHLELRRKNSLSGCQA